MIGITAIQFFDIHPDLHARGFLLNFAVLFTVSLLQYFWWTTVFMIFFPL